MVIEVVLFANFREAVGKEKIKISAETIDELFRKVTDKYPALEEEIYVDKETVKLKEYLNIVVNGQRVNDTDNLDLKLNDGDTVRVFPPVSGG